MPLSADSSPSGSPDPDLRAADVLLLAPEASLRAPEARSGTHEGRLRAPDPPSGAPNRQSDAAAFASAKRR